MTIAASLLPEFDQEMASTRKMIELVTDSFAGWRPHEKSFTTGELALHIARLLEWGTIILKETEFDVSPPDAEPRPPVTWESVEATLAIFDEKAKGARETIEATSDADMMVAWSLKAGGETLFTMPRVSVLRLFVMNHLIHHRGQLSVYLRMQDVALPEVYGPTADSEGVSA